jgi:hypothetical protein
MFCTEKLDWNRQGIPCSIPAESLQADLELNFMIFFSECYTTVNFLDIPTKVHKSKGRTLFVVYV